MRRRCTMRRRRTVLGQAFVPEIGQALFQRDLGLPPGVLRDPANIRAGIDGAFPPPAMRVDT